nr:hypothetical protein BaRGS_005981 [Batillaria attramentaria]
MIQLRKKEEIGKKQVQTKPKAAKQRRVSKVGAREKGLLKAAKLSRSGQYKRDKKLKLTKKEKENMKEASKKQKMLKSGMQRQKKPHSIGVFPEELLVRLYQVSEVKKNRKMCHIIDNGNLHFIVQAKKEIAKGSEITIPFDFNYQDWPAEKPKRKRQASGEGRTREERKMEAIMKAFEKMAKREERRKEALARLDKKHHDVKDLEGKVVIKIEDPAPSVDSPVKSQRLAMAPDGAHMSGEDSREDMGGDHMLSLPTTPTPGFSDLTHVSPDSAASYMFHKTKKHLYNEWSVSRGPDGRNGNRMDPLEVQIDFVTPLKKRRLALESGMVGSVGYQADGAENGAGLSGCQESSVSKTEAVVPAGAAFDGDMTTHREESGENVGSTDNEPSRPCVHSADAGVPNRTEAASDQDRVVECSSASADTPRVVQDDGQEGHGSPEANTSWGSLRLSERGDINMQPVSSMSLPTGEGEVVNGCSISSASSEDSYGAAPSTSVSSSEAQAAQPPAPVTKRKVSLFEYRKRLKGKTGSSGGPSSSPKSTTSDNGYTSRRSILDSNITLAPLPLFEPITINSERRESRDKEKEKREKPMSLSDRLRIEFGLEDSEEEERVNSAAASSFVLHRTSVPDAEPSALQERR